jgi:hypothetical protein
MTEEPKLPDEVMERIENHAMAIERNLRLQIKRAILAEQLQDCDDNIRDMGTEIRHTAYKIGKACGLLGE